MVTWKKSTVSDSDETMNTVEEGCVLNNSDDGCMRSDDSEGDTLLECFTVV
jgi:hypothetical protein